jgi:hypothetical protein
MARNQDITRIYQVSTWTTGSALGWQPGLTTFRAYPTSFRKPGCWLTWINLVLDLVLPSEEHFGSYVSSDAQKRVNVDSTSSPPRPHLVRKRSGDTLHLVGTRTVPGDSTSCPPRLHLMRKRSGKPSPRRHQDTTRRIPPLPTSSVPRTKRLPEPPHLIRTRTNTRKIPPHATSCGSAPENSHLVAI